MFLPGSLSCLPKEKRMPLLVTQEGGHGAQTARHMWVHLGAQKAIPEGN